MSWRAAASLARRVINGRQAADHQHKPPIINNMSVCLTWLPAPAQGRAAIGESQT